MLTLDRRQPRQHGLYLGLQDAGAVAGMLVAACRQQAGGGGSLQHAIWASASFAALAVWPAGAWRRGPSVPWGLRPVAFASPPNVTTMPSAVAVALFAVIGTSAVAKRAFGRRETS